MPNTRCAATVIQGQSQSPWVLVKSGASMTAGARFLLMPKAPAKDGLFGWRRGEGLRKIAIFGPHREAREMSADSLAKSIKMLKGILDGKTYVAVAQESGLSRSAVEQRVKALARDLQTVVGVEWVDEDEVATVRAMRTRKDNYLEALEHYHPQRAVNARKGPRVLTDQDIERAVAVIQQHSNCRKRDTALLLVLFSTAAKPLEIARLVVSDYLTEVGLVREESVMRADAAINGRERPLFFASTKVVAAVDAYLEERARRGLGTKKWTKYRGLDPDSRLFLTEDGHKMPIKVRAIGERRQYRCGIILDIYRRIFARAGLKGVSALCARRTVAEKLTERGCDVDQVGAVLGLTERNSVRNLIHNEHESRKSLKAIVRELV
jgi:integrase